MTLHVTHGVATFDVGSFLAPEREFDIGYGVRIAGRGDERMLRVILGRRLGFRGRARRRRLYSPPHERPPPDEHALMVLTKPELIASLQNEVRILLHLASKVDRAKLDYRPTPNQRSTIELLRYLTMMGPALLKAAKTAHFDGEGWTASEQAASAMDFDHVVATIAKQPDAYAAILADMTDADFRTEIVMFDERSSRGSFMVNQVLCGCAAYRTQLFLYLKACGHEELSTMNLWAGMDAPTAA